MHEADKVAEMVGKILVKYIFGQIEKSAPEN